MGAVTEAGASGAAVGVLSTLVMRGGGCAPLHQIQGPECLSPPDSPRHDAAGSGVEPLSFAPCLTARETPGRRDRWGWRFFFNAMAGFAKSSSRWCREISMLPHFHPRTSRILEPAPRSQLGGAGVSPRGGASAQPLAAAGKFIPASFTRGHKLEGPGGSWWGVLGLGDPRWGGGSRAGGGSCRSRGLQGMGHVGVQEGGTGAGSEGYWGPRGGRGAGWGCKG